ncbi:MAG: hypothetical protein QOF09_4645, partial [Alphaproteobacteria bacterium]|nr:hypothetical protein [Alphaproteobacteria bacterium]
MRDKHFWRTPRDLKEPGWPPGRALHRFGDRIFAGTIILGRAQIAPGRHP